MLQGYVGQAPLRGWGWRDFVKMIRKYSVAWIYTPQSQGAIVANEGFSCTEITDRKHVIILVVTVAGSGVDLKCTISVGYIYLSLGPSYDKDGKVNHT